MSSVGEHVRSFAMMAYCECIFLPHPLTSVLPLLHRTVSGIAISPIGGMFCLLSYCIRYCYIRLEGMCTFIRNDGLHRMHFLAFSSDFCLASPSSQQVLLFKSFTGNNMRAYRVKNNVLHTLIQKVEFDRKSKRRYELFRTGSETKRTMATSDGSDTIDSDDE
jgi:hypothetical protein